MPSNADLIIGGLGGLGQAVGQQAQKSSRAAALQKWMQAALNGDLHPAEAAKNFHAEMGGPQDMQGPTELTPNPIGGFAAQQPGNSGLAGAAFNAPQPMGSGRPGLDALPALEDPEDVRAIAGLIHSTRPSSSLSFEQRLLLEQARAKAGAERGIAVEEAKAPHALERAKLFADASRENAATRAQSNRESLRSREREGAADRALKNDLAHLADETKRALEHAKSSNKDSTAAVRLTAATVKSLRSELDGLIKNQSDPFKSNSAAQARIKELTSQLDEAEKALAEKMKGLPGESGGDTVMVVPPGGGDPVPVHRSKLDAALKAGGKLVE